MNKIMIKEDYVSFETAKLLKEKGFDEPCDSKYYGDDGSGPSYNRGPWEYGGDVVSASNSDLDDGSNYTDISAPTLQMAMKWLRDVHNVLLVVDYEWECDKTPFYFKIYRLGENGEPERVAVKGVSYDKDDNPTEHIVGYRQWERSNGDYETYEQACEAAIQYCLNNLI